MLRLHRLQRYADEQRCGGLGRAFDRSNKGAQSLVRRGLRHRGATRQHRCAIRGRHRFWPRFGSQGGNQHSGRRRATEEFQGRQGHAHERSAGHPRRSYIDGQSSDRSGPDVVVMVAPAVNNAVARSQACGCVKRR